jgi:hypothetical protein
MNMDQNLGICACKEELCFVVSIKCAGDVMVCFIMISLQTVDFFCLKIPFFAICTGTFNKLFRVSCAMACRKVPTDTLL